MRSTLFWQMHIAMGPHCSSTLSRHRRIASKLARSVVEKTSTARRYLARRSRGEDARGRVSARDEAGRDRDGRRMRRVEERRTLDSTFL